MADTTIANFTDGVTANATDRIAAVRSPFAAGDDIYHTPAYYATYLRTLAHTWALQQSYTVGISIGGTSFYDPGAPTFQIEGTLPVIAMRENDASANNRLWETFLSTGRLVNRVISDDLGTNAEWLSVGRSGGTVTDVTLANGNIGIGQTPASTNAALKLQLYRATDTNFVAQNFKVGSDNADDNTDGGAIVKHGLTYAGTSGYAHAFQVYSLARGAGLILGSNNFAGVTVPPAPGSSEVASGFLRFEMGPVWPRSEVARFNNGGAQGSDLLLGWTSIRTHTASQSGTTVTRTVTDFVAADVGTYFRWEGTDSFVDKITAFISASQVTVETSRTIASQVGRVFVPRTRHDAAGNFILNAGQLHMYNGVALAGSVNYERTAFYTSGSLFAIETQKGGTGVRSIMGLSALSFRFFHGASGAETENWNISATGHILSVTPNTFDIGVGGTVRTLQCGTSTICPLRQFGGTAATNAALQEKAVTNGWGLSLRSGANTNGQTVDDDQVTELLTIAAAATTDTTIQIPVDAIAYAVSVRVTTVIPTAATFDVGVAGATTRYATGVSTAATTTNKGTSDGMRYYGTATAIRITPNLTPADNTGRLRVTIHYRTVTAPTS